MRFALTVERYWPSIGGAERVVQRIGEGVARRGHDVLVVTSGRRSSELLGGVRVERFPVAGNLATGIKGNVDEPLRSIRAFNPDLVMCYAAQTWTTDACIRFLGERAFRLVLAPCGFSALGNRRYTPYFERMRQLLPRYDALIFHSDIYRDWDFALSAGATEVHVIPNGADPVDAAPIKTKGDRYVVTTVGSHVRSKGHGDFIKAIQRLGGERSVRGIIVAPRRMGTGLLRGCQPRCLVVSLCLGGTVELRDGRNEDVVGSTLAEADLFLFPSRIECAPLVVLEAMAARVPWISYDVGNVRELAGGIVVDCLDDMVEAGKGLLASPARQKALGAEGYEAWRGSHQWNDLIEQYERLFIRVVGAQDPDGAQV